MITITGPKRTKKLSDDEQRQSDASQIGFLAFMQTLPADAVVTDEGVYSSRSEQFLAQRERDLVAGASDDDASADNSDVQSAGSDNTRTQGGGNS